MKAHFRLDDSIETLVNSINDFGGDLSAVEPNGKHYGYYLEFFEESFPDAYCVFFGDQIVISSRSRDEIVCFLWGLLLGHKNEKSMNEYRSRDGE